MSDPPGGIKVRCPECEKPAWAIVPKKARIVERDEDTDGKVWVNCRKCGHRFLAYYRET